MKKYFCFFIVIILALNISFAQKNENDYRILDEKELIKKKVSHNPFIKKYRIEIDVGSTIINQKVLPKDNFLGIDFLVPSFSINLFADNIVSKINIRRTYFLFDLSYLYAKSIFNTELRNIEVGNVSADINRLSINLKFRHFFSFYLTSPSFDIKAGYKIFLFSTNYNDVVIENGYRNLKDYIVDSSFFSPSAGINLKFPFKIAKRDFGVLVFFDYLFFPIFSESPLNATGEFSKAYGFFYGGNLFYHFYKEVFFKISFEENRFKSYFSSSPLTNDSVRSIVMGAQTNDVYRTLNIGIGYNF